MCEIGIYEVNKLKVILASKSPRRREILEMITNNYEVIVSGADENIEEDISIEELAKKLAFIKAKSVFDKTEGDRIVIGSDTMVVLDNVIYGKPKNREDAKCMLRKLKNTNHQVITSLSVLIQKDNEYFEYVDYDIAEVYFNDMTDKEIDKWLDTGEAFDKAGAYAVQGTFAKHIEKISGNYWTVMGLPINKLYNILKKHIDV